MKYASISEIGFVREENQDSVAVERTDDAILAVVCDGIGGGNAGSLASKMSVDLLVEAFKNKKTFNNENDIRAWFSDTITKVNYKVHKKSFKDKNYHGMGTTLIAIILFEGFIYGFNIGDSRVYTYKDGVLNKLSHDQTYAYELYLKNKITKEEVDVHPKRNILMNAVGIDKNISYETIEKTDEWDQILLSSDGLHGFLDKSTIEKTLALPTLQERKDRLLELVYQTGAFDNVSFILIDGEDDE